MITGGNGNKPAVEAGGQVPRRVVARNARARMRAAAGNIFLITKENFLCKVKCNYILILLIICSNANTLYLKCVFVISSGMHIIFVHTHIL